MFMHIHNAYPAANATYASQVNGAKAAESIQVSRGGSIPHDADSVTISDAARRAADAEDAIPGAGAQGGSSGAYPLEMYQVPSWRAEYMFQVPNKLGVGADWFAGKYPQAASASEVERSEYAELVQGHYQAVLEANGIQGVEAHYQATILDRNVSESLRQQMNERVQNDDRLLELMVKMGKPIL